MSNMQEVLAQQSAAFYSVSRALDNFKKIAKSHRTAAKVRSRISTLRDIWTHCTQQHAALINICPEDKRRDVSYFENDDYGVHEEIYQTALDYMNERLEELEPVVSHDRTFNLTLPPCESTSFSVNHLPPIKLPPFDGNPDEWESFRDRFQSLISNNKELSDFSRMHFLVASVTGGAREALSGISVTAENFQIAWKALEGRYENKRRLIEIHVAALYNLPKITRESASDLHALCDKTERAISALKNLERSPENIMSDILVYFLFQKLDPATRRAWKLKNADSKDPPTYDELNKFLSSRALALGELQPHDAGKYSRNSKTTSASVSTTTSTTCSLCKQRHMISQCAQFIAKSPTQRREVIKQFKRCFNCLREGHSVQACRSRFTCQKCQQRHHTTLHINANSSAQAAIASTGLPSQEQATEPPNVSALSAVTLTTAPTPVVLSTATVTIHSPNGRALTVRSLLDGGSELTFMTERVAQILRLTRTRTYTSTSGINCVDAGICKAAAVIHITPRDTPTPTFTTTAYILKSLTKYIPRGAASISEWTHLSNLKLADDDPTGSTPIDLIIGSDLYNRVLVNVQNGSIGQPGAIQSHFGWVLSGPTSDPSHIVPGNCDVNPHYAPARVINSDEVNNHHVVTHCCSLENEMQKFWEVEEISPQNHRSPDEQRCEDHFLSTHSRSSDGRYIVRLPFRTNPPINIGESRAIAERRLASLLCKLETQPDLKGEYFDFLAEYEQLNHMTRVLPVEPSQAPVVYIPHHPVVRSTSCTTRLRVVFDASCKTTNGTSLNTHLLPGPKLQLNLPAIILRWRLYKYVYSADIAKMYRQILVDPRDRDHQRILWTDDKSNVQEYRLRTVTYGTASAPFLALRVIQQLNADDGSAFPLASPVLKNNIYVDDVLFGANDISLLIQTRDQVCALLQGGGFYLRKWASNRSELLADIQPENHGLAFHKTLEIDDNLKVLGIAWNPACDVFQFKVVLPETIPFTKRSILSTIAKLYDPLGWATPVTLAAKVFMQTLWRLKLDWDTVIPNETLRRWNNIYRSLSHMNELKLTRWIGRDADTAHVEIHGFADASTVVYAAVSYLRVTSLSGTTITTLLAGKSKVAPLKTMTIPRLELSAAVLLSKLIDFVVHSFNLKNTPIHCWTDSTVTLAWLSKPPSHWKTFVAHRVADIQTRLPNADWHYVRSSSNPADCASRGMLGEELVCFELWWTGPSWLKLDCTEWPILDLTASNENLLEAKSSVVLTAQPREPWDLAMRYSWWPKLVRVTAYTKRFVNHLKKGKKLAHASSPAPDAITPIEFHQSKLSWVRVMQAELFPTELNALGNKNAVSAKSPISSLHPFLDSDQVMRVGGRLTNASLPYKTKHPIVLAAHPITLLIIRYIHITSLHAGTQLTLATIRREFWILRARNLVKSVIHKCVTCVREKAQTSRQLMGQLPTSRISVSCRAFLNCGVDYAGPFATRASAGRGIASRKSYIAVFICLATRAIHLELVTDYSTSAFLNAYLRFCARRGLPKSMHSDNGTTFVGADKELKQAYYQALQNPDFLNRTAVDNTEWKFIPPHAPHFGGLWEAGVKSVKYHLRRVLRSYTLTFEELTTVLCRVEACLNSRPLAPLTDSLDELEPLTPGHFLIGAALTTSPEPSLLNINESRLSRWQLLRHITERFWKLWQADYKYVTTTNKMAPRKHANSSWRYSPNTKFPPTSLQVGNGQSYSMSRRF